MQFSLVLGLGKSWLLILSPPPTTFFSLSFYLPPKQYSYHSLYECLLKIDGNGHMESFRAYLRYGSLEHNWQVESKWIGQEYYLPTDDSCLKMGILFEILASKMIEGYFCLLLLLSQQNDQKMTLIT